ncbi:hypothetical protein BDR07DRAFT_1410956 [Suillus spraguei]|nr:hypothetical protein BDR07DRAFT_1418291 [Suillus spraguei]KAG2360953.1 hypothetical protein BDR07DRAFT_1410956 [Suillus spraguei]
MVGTVLLELANMLRSPPESKRPQFFSMGCLMTSVHADCRQRKLVTEFIAPTIALMCPTSPLSMNSMFSSALIEKFAVCKNIDCTDFAISD